MGNTHYSVATVLTVFMSGLALGSYLGGLFIDRKGNPLIAYAALEAGIGIYCFLVPHMIEAALPLLKWIYSNYHNDYATAGFWFAPAFFFFRRLSWERRFPFWVSSSQRIVRA